MSKASDTTDRYLGWLIQEIQLYESYHNHKETMAWVATAFYIPGIITFGYSVAQTNWFLSLLVSILIAIVFYPVVTFVNMQFRKRWEANDIQVGLMRLVAGLCSSSVTPPSEPDIKEGDHWPLFIQESINQSTRKREFWSAVRDMTCFRLSTLDDRWKTELPSYGLILIATIVALFLVWRNLLFC